MDRHRGRHIGRCQLMNWESIDQLFPHRVAQSSNFRRRRKCTVHPRFERIV